MTESQRNDLEEERRLFYVGVTRAKHNLAIFDYTDKSWYNYMALT